jgi:hypothetical protein
MKAKDLSTKAQQCFEYLQADPGDQPLADCLMTILRQLPQVCPWLRLDKLVSIYQLGYGAKLDAQLDRYRRLDSLETVLQFDNLYKYKDEKDQKEKIYRHQHRLGAVILRSAGEKLSKQTNLIAQCQSFEELLQRVQSATRPVHQFGPLAVYDTALRIGAKRDMWPEVVYLHAGTMKGYKELMKTRVKQGWVPLDDLPEEVRVLEPHHAENFLCIFEGLFNNSGSRGVGKPCC